MLVSADEPLEREFEDAVRTSADLAVRGAFSIRRRREDAEEIAQEAYARAYRRFRDLREPQQFRAWMVRVTWRLAIDRWRADRRRSAREQAAGEGTAGIDAEERRCAPSVPRCCGKRLKETTAGLFHVSLTITGSSIGLDASKKTDVGSGPGHSLVPQLQLLIHRAPP